MQRRATSLRMIRPLGARPRGKERGLSSAYLRCRPSLGHWQERLRSVVRAVKHCALPGARALSHNTVWSTPSAGLYLATATAKSLPASELWNGLIDLLDPKFNAGGDNAQVLSEMSHSGS
jgi:hypothetical protein